MRIFHLLLPVLITGALLFSLAAIVPAEENRKPESVRLHSVQADFRQEKHLQILARPIISSGIFVFQAPGSLRWEYRSPIRSVLLMHGGRVKKFVEQDGSLQEDRTMGFGAMQVVLADIVNWLDGRFEDNDMFRVDFSGDKTIMLMPKDQGLAALISSIELTTAGQEGLLDAVTIFEGPHSSTKLIFSNQVLNRAIPASLFIEP